MSASVGPKLKLDNLLLAYDMNNTVDSWKGKPTTNLIPVSSLATDTKVKTGDYYGTYKGILRTGIANDNPRTYWFNSSAAVSASTTYTLSCLYWSSDGVLDDVYLRFTDTGWPESNNFIQPFTSQSVTRNGSFTVTDIGDNWKYCVGTFDTLATTTTLNQCFFDVDLAGREVFIANVQFEEGSFATPFVDGTRFTTNALLNYGNGTGISATSLTYNADNTFEFNGSTDYLTHTINSPGGELIHSINFWMMLNSNQSAIATRVDPFSMGTAADSQYSAMDISNGNLNWYFFNNDTRLNYNVFLANTWYNVCLVYEGGGATTSTKKLYINGEFIPWALSSGATYGNALNLPVAPNLWIGRDGGRNTAYFPGKIEFFNFYNVPLTADEVYKNFNALRSRFGV